MEKTKNTTFSNSRELIGATPLRGAIYEKPKRAEILVPPFLVAQAAGLLGVAVIETRAISELP